MQLTSDSWRKVVDPLCSKDDDGARLLQPGSFDALALAAGQVLLPGHGKTEPPSHKLQPPPPFTISTHHAVLLYHLIILIQLIDLL